MNMFIDKFNNLMLRSKMNHKKIILGALLIIILLGITSFLVNKQKETQASVEEQKAPIALASSSPQKTDFGTGTPADFPTDIPVEKDAKVQQSYGLNYAGQKQLTIVFSSIKTVKENYALYSGFLTNNNWTIVNKYESMNVTSLYCTKESSDINVTINGDTTTPMKSQVSISVLKK